jgi:hypothetical protein
MTVRFASFNVEPPTFAVHSPAAAHAAWISRVSVKVGVNADLLDIRRR